MIIIWNGAGILVPIIGGVFVYSMHYVITQVCGLGNQYFQTHMWCSWVTGLVTGGVLFGLGRMLNKDEGGHSFFFIPVEYWGILAGIAGFVAPFVK